MKADQERVAKLLNDTVTLLCKNGLIYKSSLTVQGLLGITLDTSDVFLVHINETIGAPSTADASQKLKQNFPVTASVVVDLTTISDSPSTANSQQQQQPHVLRHRGQVGSPISGSVRKQRPQAINQAMILQRNELLQQVQQRLRMNASAIFPASVPVVPASSQSFQPRQQQTQPRPQKLAAGRPGSLQQTQSHGPITVEEEDDVVIVGTGKEEVCSSPRGNHAPARTGRPFLVVGRNPRIPSNESHPIVIQQDPAPVDVSYVAQRMHALEGIPGLDPAAFGESKSFLGEIVIEPTDPKSIDVVELDEASALPACRPRLVGVTGNRSGAENRDGDERIAVYLDIADEGGQDNFNPCCSRSLPREVEPSGDAPTARDERRKPGEESIDLDSLGLHMLTEADDEAPPTPTNPWQCKAPSCQALYPESSQLASHYTLKHSRQLDLSVKETPDDEAIVMNINDDSNNDVSPMESGETEGPSFSTYHGRGEIEPVVQSDEESNRESRGGKLGLERPEAFGDRQEDHETNALWKAGECSVERSSVERPESKEAFHESIDLPDRSLGEGEVRACGSEDDNRGSLQAIPLLNASERCSFLLPLSSSSHKHPSCLVEVPPVPSAQKRRATSQESGAIRADRDLPETNDGSGPLSSHGITEDDSGLRCDSSEAVDEACGGELNSLDDKMDEG